MDEEPKDVRLPVMVTKSEAAAIDDWRFANRIGTRAEAIRRLIARGLTLSGDPLVAGYMAFRREWIDETLIEYPDESEYLKSLQEQPIDPDDLRSRMQVLVEREIGDAEKLALKERRKRDAADRRKARRTVPVEG